MSVYEQLLRGLSKRRVFVSYHHARDQGAYDTLAAYFSTAFEVFSDRSLDREIDSDNAEYVYRYIRENYITGSSVTIVLVGAESWKRKFIDWEIRATLDSEHGLLGIQLPSLPVNAQGRVSVPVRLHKNIMSGYASWRTWPNNAVELKLAIEDAVARSAARDRIVNNDPMMSRNLA